jgi:hypothetical protein
MEFVASLATNPASAFGRCATLKRSQCEKPSKCRHTENNGRLTPREVVRRAINIGHRLVFETAGIFFDPIGHAAD